MKKNNNIRDLLSEEISIVSGAKCDNVLCNILPWLKQKSSIFYSKDRPLPKPDQAKILLDKFNYISIRLQ